MGDRAYSNNIDLVPNYLRFSSDDQIQKLYSFLEWNFPTDDAAKHVKVWKVGDAKSIPLPYLYCLDKLAIIYGEKKNEGMLKQLVCPLMSQFDGQKCKRRNCQLVHPSTNSKFVNMHELVKAIDKLE